MTQPTYEQPTFPCYRVRILLPGGTIHLVTLAEPRLEEGVPVLDIVPGYGDTLGLIKWDRVDAISWRFFDPDLGRQSGPESRI